MRKLPKINFKNNAYKVLLLIVIMLPFVIYNNFQNEAIEEKIGNCSKITLIKVVRTYNSRGMARMEFYYIADGMKYQFTESVGAGKQVEGFWFVDLESLKKKRLFVQYACQDAENHKLLWNVSVPDSLTYIPKNGWTELPYGLAKYEQVERSWWDKIIHP